MVAMGICHNATKLPIASTLCLVWATYEVRRIHRGTHPYFTPRLEAAGIASARKTAATSAVGAGASVGKSNASIITWTDLNGMPIPTLASLVRPAGGV